MRALATLAAVVVMTVAGASPAPADDAPVPEGYQAPLSTSTVRQVWEAPLSTSTRFYTRPKTQEPQALEEALGAERDSGEKLVRLSDRFLFDFDSADLRPTASASLKTLAALLEETTGPVRVVGHTDALGGDAVNQPLSEERARSVADFLEKQGVPKSRLKTEGKGSSDPVADNTNADGSDNPQGRQQNRRVEVRYQG